MKKLLLLVLALSLGWGLKAQCPLTTAVDFTATDCHGTEVHLFDILDGGQYVLIDFFFTTCGPCQQATPNIVQSYYSFGCNMHDVYYMEISVSDANAACQNWATSYGVEYPTIGTTGGGNSICTQYQISYYPTVILVAPDRSIVIQDLWPISTPQAVISALEAQGVTQHDCNGSTYNPDVAIHIDQVLETEATITFTPNEDCASFKYMVGTEDEIQTGMGSQGMTLPEYLNSYGFPAEAEISHTFTDLTPQTEYMIYALPIDPDGNFGEVAFDNFITTNGVGEETIEDFTATDIKGNEINLYDILDSGQAVLINFFLYGDNISENIMRDMVEAYQLYGCNGHDVFFMEISPNGGDASCQTWVETFGVEYPTISRDGGGNDIVQAIPVAFFPTIMLIRPDHTFAIRDIYPPTLDMMVQYMSGEGYEQHECQTGVIESDDQTYTLFPNPANESMTIKGENLGTVGVYNALGQQVESIEASGNELNINTANYLNGVYFIKVNETTMRFVVSH